MQTIWEDPDVRDIVEPRQGQPYLLLEDLDDVWQPVLVEFVGYDERVARTAPASVAFEACCAGIRVVERLPQHLAGTNALGWRKFVIYATAGNVQILWEAHQDARAPAIGGWVLEALTSVGGTPDGFTTALGTAYSATMSIHGSATAIDPVSGAFIVRGGDDGRSLAGVRAGQSEPSAADPASKVAAAGTAPASWHPDPTGRHQQRYWDGSRWTEHVADDGATSTDAV